MRRGATDYIPKPFTPAQVKLSVNKVAQIRSLEQKVFALQEDVGRLNPEFDFSTTSQKMQQAINEARQVAPSDATVLLRGESGTGKTVLARMLHVWSRRAQKPFGVVSCPTLSTELLESELFGHAKGAFTGAVRDNPGRVAACEGGTLLLDEIGDVPLALQPKLLRFLQEREYERVGEYAPRKADVRVIAATNIDIEQAVADGRFREDLFYRLNVIRIEIPPLRQRQEDIGVLAQRLLTFFGRNNHRLFKGFTDDALQALKGYAWPGNIRELRNVIERASILCPTDTVGSAYLPAGIAPDEALPQLGDPVPLKQIEEQHIRRVLAATKSLQEAAAVLDIDQATLWRKRREYGI
jgi:NtrC-family two-component system response regulator AlgB